jgi:hypothetical protein
MADEDILREIASLPPEGQRQVVNFIAFLHRHYAHLESAKELENSDLIEDGFVGMWRDHEDMRDSSTWVRNSRVREWLK